MLEAAGLDPHPHPHPHPGPYPGELQGVLEAAGIAPRRDGGEVWNGYTGDPFEFLPKWMSKNPLRAK